LLKYSTKILPKLEDISVVRLLPANTLELEGQIDVAISTVKYFKF